MTDIYYDKYLKYKNKYINLKKMIGGALYYYHELLESNILIYSKNTEEPEEELIIKQITDLVKSFNPEIEIIELNTEAWMQDIIISMFKRWENNVVNLLTYDNDLSTTIDAQNVAKALQPKIKDIEVIYIKLTPPMHTDDDITKSKKENDYHLAKGGNSLILPEKVGDEEFNAIGLEVDEKFTKAGCKYSKICLKIYNPNFKYESREDDSVDHIDEILTIIPTGLGNSDYKLLFYKPIVIDDESMQTKMTEIYEFNLEILKKYFPEDKIISIDTEFKSNGKLKHPPLFNRIIFRKKNEFMIIFPEQHNITTRTFIDNMIATINTENNVDGFRITHHYVNSDYLHNLHGNLHCKFKVLPKTI